MVRCKFKLLHLLQYTFIIVMKILLLDNNKLQYKQHIWYNLLYIYKCV